MRGPALLTAWVLPIVSALPVAAAQQPAPGDNLDPPAEAVSADAHSHAARPTIRAARLAGSIRLDGRLDEEAWAQAVPATTFTQLDPKEGQPASRSTEVRVLIGPTALYIGAHMFDTPGNIRSRLARKDESVDGDVLGVSIDSRHDHLTAYFFRVSAGGALRDAVITRSQDYSFDLSWDAVWDAKVNRDETGWSVEIEIPLSQLPYNQVSDPVWGIQFERYGWNQQELSQFAFTPKNESGGVQRFGHLVGLGELPTPSRVEVSPYVSSRAEYTNVPQGNPFRSGHDYFASGGGDLRLRVSSNLSLNATLNPDFGQVEVDPAVVNLTAFETFFPEKRPFFVEGQELFQYGQLRTFNSSTFPTLFFSRRIGRAPQRDLDTTSFHYATSPPQSTIATAAKLTGKTSSGWSLGLMEAATLEEQADFRDNLSLSQRTPVEPFTNYVVGRVRREMNLGASQAGIFFSAVNRDLSDPNLRDMLRSGAYVAGADLNHSWANRSWALDASFARSQIQGNTAAILDAQNSSRRYYGRPDATSFHLDSTRTALTGFAGQVALTRTSATHWVGNLAYQVVSPGFEVNDVGFQTAADRHAVSSDLTYRDNTPHKILRTFRYDVFTNQGWNFDGNNVNNNFATSSFGIFRNFSGYFVRADFNPETTDDRLTRGGPLARLPRGWSTWWEYFSDPRKVYTADAHVFYVSDRGLNHRTELGVIFRLQPNPTLILSFEPLYTTTHHSAQYLDTESDPLATSTYGSRYIFGTLDQKELSLVTRLSLTFTPKLSLQVYAQPLVSAGNYTSFSQLRAPRTYAFDVYGRDVGSVTRANQQVTIDPDGNPGTANSFTLDEPNFNFRSLRGNAVLRWEYRPGSTIFLVWQQSRSDTQVLGDFRFGRDFSGLFDTKPENVFAVKMTYWLAR